MATNLSFAGAGFLGIYQTGVAACLTSYGRKFLENIKYFGGSSAGAMCAVNLICGIKMEPYLQFVMETSASIRDTTLFGPLTAKIDFVMVIKKFYSTNLSPQAYKLVTGRLFISLTRVSDWKNVIISEFASNRDLIDALACAIFIPFYSGIKPPQYRGVSYVDGGLTDNLLQHFEGTNITVSVFSGDCDICPDDGQRSDVLLDCKNMPFEITGENTYRLIKALFPLGSSELTELCRQGFRDTLKYLNSTYPDMLSFDVDIVSVPYCCGGIFTKDCNEKRELSCWCGSTNENDDSKFSELEKEIAREKVINSMVVPEEFYQALLEVENVVGEKDFTYHAFTTLLHIIKWLNYPNYYATKHIYDFVNDLVLFLFPLLEKSITFRNIFKMTQDAFSTGKFEWHPSISKDKQENIENARKRLMSAQNSFVALRNASLTSMSPTWSVSSDGSDLSYHGRSRPSSVFSDDVFEDDETEVKYSSRGFRLFVNVGRVLFSNTVGTDDDYGNDLDYTTYNDVEQDDELSDHFDDDER